MNFAAILEQTDLTNVLGAIATVGLFLIAVAGGVYHVYQRSLKNFFRDQLEEQRKYIDDEARKSRLYHYNTMTAVFRVLAKLHPEPEKQKVINESMMEFMISAAAASRANGEVRAASSGMGAV